MLLLHKREVGNIRSSQKMIFTFFDPFYVMLPLTNGVHYSAMPAMLAREYEIALLINGKWKTVFSEQCNIRRCVPVVFEARKADGIRLTVRSAWGKGKKVHLFAFEPKE